MLYYNLIIILARSRAERSTLWGQCSATQSFSRPPKHREVWMAPSNQSSFPIHHLLSTLWGQQQAGKALICTVDIVNKDSCFLWDPFFCCCPSKCRAIWLWVRGKHPLAKVLFGWRWALSRARKDNPPLVETLPTDRDPTKTSVSGLQRTKMDLTPLKQITREDILW